MCFISTILVFQRWLFFLREPLTFVMLYVGVITVMSIYSATNDISDEFPGLSSTADSVAYNFVALVSLALTTLIGYTSTKDGEP